MTPCEGAPFAQVTGAQAFLAWDTNHVLSMGPCGDDQHRPGGAASPARQDAPRRSFGIPSVRTATPTPGSVADTPCRPSATPCAQSGEPGLVENAPRCCPARPRAGNRSQSPSRPRPRHSMRADSRPLDPSPAHPNIVPPRLALGHLTLGTVTGAPHPLPCHSLCTDR